MLFKSVDKVIYFLNYDTLYQNARFHQLEVYIDLLWSQSAFLSPVRV